MNIAARSSISSRRRPGPARRTALLAGLLYLLTFVTSVPTLALYRPVLEGTGFVLGTGSATGVLAGTSLEVLLALACVGTAVALFPVVRRHSEAAALGFLAARLVEGGLILVGVASLLSVVTLRQELAPADPATLVTMGEALVAIHDRSFLLGQSLMPAISALCLGSVLYRSGLVPRAIPLLGLIGAPLLLASDAAILWGSYSPVSALAVLAALPIALWELALALWLVVRGFSPVTAVAHAEARADSGTRGAERLSTSAS